jgi:hypothetical protein
LTLRDYTPIELGDEFTISASGGPKIGFRKAIGYGLLEFNKSEGAAKISLNRLGPFQFVDQRVPATVSISGSATVVRSVP